MLSNKDFSKLLDSGGGKNGGDDKVRFDMKQIAQWDKQIKAKMKSKTSDGSVDPKSKDSSTSEKVEGEAGYRDRADERRKDANPDYDNDTMKAIQTLDVEKTKFLGGDVDHTHLVKGLDYTLLKKIRNQVEIQAQTLLNDNKSSVDFKTDFQPVTAIGDRLKALMLQTCVPDSKSQEPLSAHHKTGVSVFARTFYDYDVDPTSDLELPTVVVRSRLVRATRQTVGSQTVYGG